LTRVAPSLTAHEAENNLLLGLAARGFASDERDGVWLAVLEGEQIVGAAVRTPPHYVTVSRLPPGAARAVADWFFEHGNESDGASGPAHHARDVALALAERSGGSIDLCMGDTLYELTELVDVPLPSGFARPATLDDLPTVTRFYAEFYGEVNLPGATDPLTAARTAITLGWVHVWDDGGPRSLASSSRGTPTGATIGPVYTPRDSRRRGYASALTAALARRLLTSGKRFVCLFADRKNPTSNHIYQTLGFVPRGDFDVWRVRPR
jgi:predicted GNAT family acetyltransferase